MILYIYDRKFLLRVLFVYIALVLNVQLYANQALDDTKQLTQILHKIYVASGYDLSECPKIEISKSANLAAVYIPSKNIIQLDQKLINLCKSFGKDANSALAFILSHELSHAIFKDKSSGLVPTNFLNYGKNFKTKVKEEKIADIQGAFIAYLAGYQPDKVIPKLIENIYKAYQLHEANTDNYPSLAERKLTAQLVLSQIKDLVNVFEASNITLAKAEYELAALGYSYMLEYYRGPELFNNLGICYALKAMEYFNETTDHYAYPIEIDANTYLKKIQKSRGSLPLDQRMTRNNVLQKATQNIQEAIRLNPNKLSYKINYLCCLILLDNKSKCDEYIKTQNLEELLNTNFRSNNQSLKLTLGIFQAVNSKISQNVYFDEIIMDAKSPYRAMAITNKNVLNRIETNTQYYNKCNYKFKPAKNTISRNEINISKFKKISFSSLGISLSYLSDKYIQTYIYANSDGDLLKVIQQNPSSVQLPIVSYPQICLTNPKIGLILFGGNKFVVPDNLNRIFMINSKGTVKKVLDFVYY